MSDVDSRSKPDAPRAQSTSERARSDDGTDVEPTTTVRTQDSDLEPSHQTSTRDESSEAPPLPEDEVPPLPDEAPPTDSGADDGWEPVWEESTQAYYFFNRLTGASTWTNPRVPEGPAPGADAGVAGHDRIGGSEEGSGSASGSGSGGDEARRSRPHGGYDPAIHGDYDPTASYAQDPQAGNGDLEAGAAGSGADPNAIYTATGVFNRFTGKWQPTSLTPENFNDENKSRRQMNAFFDVDAAANSHDGKSLKAERSGKKLTKQEVKNFKEKRRERKEEKRRAWLRD
ncbi:MAG: hypothetical protein M4579_003416 [Chaenotheca gracillima]|nr:MAG: hypothetical protein M4579_003416 [Chaenotheca gracillima]